MIYDIYLHERTLRGMASVEMHLFLEIRMDTLLDSLIRFYELKHRDTVVANTTTEPTAVTDPASHDASTFPYLP